MAYMYAMYAYVCICMHVCICIYAYGICMHHVQGPIGLLNSLTCSVWSNQVFLQFPEIWLNINLIYNFVIIIVGVASAARRWWCCYCSISTSSSILIINKQPLWWCHWLFTIYDAPNQAAVMESAGDQGSIGCLRILCNVLIWIKWNIFITMAAAWA